MISRLILIGIDSARSAGQQSLRTTLKCTHTQELDILLNPHTHHIVGQRTTNQRQKGKRKVLYQRDLAVKKLTLLLFSPFLFQNSCSLLGHTNKTLSIAYPVSCHIHPNFSNKHNLLQVSLLSKATLAYYAADQTLF